MKLKTCPKCTGEVQPEMNFCPDCGHNLSTIPAGQSALEASIGGAQTVVAILLVLFGLLGALITCS